MLKEKVTRFERQAALWNLFEKFGIGQLQIIILLLLSVMMSFLINVPCLCTKLPGWEALED